MILWLQVDIYSFAVVMWELWTGEWARKIPSLGAFFPLRGDRARLVPDTGELVQACSSVPCTASPPPPAAPSFTSCRPTTFFVPPASTGREPYEGLNYHALLLQLSNPDARLRPPIPGTPDWDGARGGAQRACGWHARAGRACLFSATGPSLPWPSPLT